MNSYRLGIVKWFDRPGGGTSPCGLAVEQQMSERFEDFGTFHS